MTPRRTPAQREWVLAGLSQPHANTVTASCFHKPQKSSREINEKAQPEYKQIMELV